MFSARLAVVVVALSIAFSTAIAAAEPVKKPSKIGIHIISSYTPGSRKIISANLPVMKVLGLGRGMHRALIDYKKKHPKGVVVLRVYTHFNDPERKQSKLAMPYRLEDDPTQCAKDYWENKIVPQLKRVKQDELKLIDYIEGPNEGSDCPTWTTVRDAAWYARFWLELTPLIHKAGFKPCLASIAVGNPPGSTEEITRKFKAFAPALRQAKKVGGAWSYHSYTLKYTKDPAVEYWYSLRYRQFYEIFKSDIPDLIDMPLILSEGGVDNQGNRLTDGWQERGTAEKYLDWISWFDSEIQRDPYVIGVTLFAIGDNWWKSFNLEPIADKLAEYLGYKK